MTLSPVQVAQFRERGWLAPVDVMSEEEAQDLRALLETVEADHPAELHAENRNNAHLAVPFLADVALDRRIVDVVEQLVGPDLSLWSTVLFIKEPHSGSFVSWHQDARYMALSSYNQVTAWLALTPSTFANGCVSVVPGTHLQGALPHRDTYGEGNILTRGQVVEGVDTSDAVDLELRPGQMSLHHPWLVHGSQPNSTDDRRIGIAMQTYLGHDVRPTRGTQTVMHVSGGPVPQPFIEFPRPTALFSDEGRRNRREANEHFADILYDGAEVRRKL